MSAKCVQQPPETISWVSTDLKYFFLSFLKAYLFLGPGSPCRIPGNLQCSDYTEVMVRGGHYSGGIRRSQLCTGLQRLPLLAGVQGGAGGVVCVQPLEMPSPGPSSGKKRLHALRLRFLWTETFLGLPVSAFLAGQVPGMPTPGTWLLVPGT